MVSHRRPGRKDIRFGSAISLSLSLSLSLSCILDYCRLQTVYNLNYTPTALEVQS
jgi:hypothetical protein